MTSQLPPEQRASYSVIIDQILSNADLESVSAKAIRKGLQAKVDDDLSEQKDIITALIMERFDKVQRERESGASDGAVEPAPTANGAAHAAELPSTTAASEPVKSPSNKRKATNDEEEEVRFDDDDGDDDDLSDVKDTPPPKKKSKGPKSAAVESDAQMAQRLQDEFASSRGRTTRGGGASATKKKPAAKPARKGKKKSAAKINSDDDSDVDASGSPKAEKERKGGFHKPMNLSEPLQELLGESQLSRPQTVKRIWAYVKERDLQDPSDKRQIRCDEKMRAVFKSDRVHMFTMNKVLAGQLWPVEETT